MSELPRSIFEAEIKKAVQEVFPDKVVPDPLDMVFKFWDKVAWYVGYLRSTLNRFRNNLVAEVVCCTVFDFPH